MSNKIWTVRATVASEKNGFKNVVREVHWTLTVQKGGRSKTRKGSVLLPLPTTQAAYIDLSVLQGMSRADRRATVLGWAEMVRPGFVSEQEQHLEQSLKDTEAAAIVRSVNIL